MTRLLPAFAGHELVIATVDRGYAESVECARFHVVRDATRWNKLGLALLALQVLRILCSERPDLIISTGAAPGYLALRLGKMLGARTIWIDSIANVETLSMPGAKIGRHADLWLTQWRHLARPDGPYYQGDVL